MNNVYNPEHQRRLAEFEAWQQVVVQMLLAIDNQRTTNDRAKLEITDSALALLIQTVSTEYGLWEQFLKQSAESESLQKFDRLFARVKAAFQGTFAPGNIDLYNAAHFNPQSVIRDVFAHRKPLAAEAVQLVTRPPESDAAEDKDVSKILDYYEFLYITGNILHWIREKTPLEPPDPNQN